MLNGKKFLLSIFKSTGEWFQPKLPNVTSWVLNEDMFFFEVLDFKKKFAQEEV